MKVDIKTTPFLTGYWLVCFLACKVLASDQKSFILEEGQSVNLPCLAGEAIHVATVDGISAVWLVKPNINQSSEWIEVGNGEYGKVVSVSANKWITENLTLKIDVVDLKDSGLYACSVFNASEIDQMVNSHIQLTVLEKQLASVDHLLVNVLGPRAVSVEWIPIEPVHRVSYMLLVRDRTGKEHGVDAGEATMCKLDDLLPYTEYQFQVLATNSLGQKSYGTDSGWIRTDEEAPSGKVRVIDWKGYSDFLTMDFELPPLNEWNGNLTGFIVIYSITGSDVNTKREFAVVGVDKEQQTLNVSHLLPFASYEIKIALFNQAGTGPFSEVVLVRTEEGVPSKPRILNIPIRNDTMLTVHWEQPENVNGQLLGYNLFWASHSVRDRCQFKGLQTTYEITGLLPYTEYGIQVSAFTKIGSGPKSDVHHAITDIAAPSVPISVNVSSNQSNTIVVHWWRPQNFTKQIDIYYLKYQVFGEVFHKKLESKQVDMSQDFFEISISHLIPTAVYEFQVAAGTKSIFTDQEYIGPYSEPQTIVMSGDVETTSDSQKGVVEPKSSLLTLGIVCGVVSCLIVSGGVMIFIISRHLIRTRYQFIADQDTGKQPAAAMLLSEIYDPISCFKESVPQEKFRDHVAALHADGDYMLSQEYEEINRMTPSNSTTSQSCEEENKQKNRYLNILAYDHSRVLLNQLPGKPKQTDYINANFVNGYKQAKAFIATQGPLPSTFGDFWRMVWEQESSVIVMITNLTEKGRRKCDQYWPTEGEHQYDNIAVRLINTRVTAHYTVRTFVIKHLRHKKRSGNERTVTQFHYTDWPDHGVPNFTLPSLTFIRKSTCSSLLPGGNGVGPVIVHCSAGVGRTGTYIVIDSMIKQIKDVHSVNVFGFLCHIRNHRNYLVQTEDQYSFIHDAILEYIQSGVTEVKDINISQYIKELTSNINCGESLIEKQYKLATSFVPKPYHFTSALATVNEGKNRSCQYLPVEISRVCLPTKAGVDGSDYINATFLQGYTKNEEYIITQHPLEDTVYDFWHMVWDQNSVTVVLLSASDEMDLKCFWPAANETTDCENFQVSFRQEKKMSNAVTSREFILQSTQDDYECTVQLIEHPNWPDGRLSMSSVYELVQMAKAWNDQHEETNAGPVIVIDRYGGTKAATFCAIAMLSDQLQRERCIDVYAVAKLYHMKRPGVFPTMEDYMFLYKVLEGIHGDVNHCEDNKDADMINCNSHTTHLQSLPHSTSHNSVNSNHSIRNSVRI